MQNNLQNTAEETQDLQVKQQSLEATDEMEEFVAEMNGSSSIVDDVNGKISAMMEETDSLKNSYDDAQLNDESATNAGLTEVSQENSDLGTPNNSASNLTPLNIDTFENSVISTKSPDEEKTAESPDDSEEAVSLQPEFHPIRDGEPFMTGIELNQLKLSILENGQMEDVIILDGKILHGRNVAKACFELGFPYRRKDYSGKIEEIPEFLKMKNLDRKQYDAIEKACFAAKKVDEVKDDSKEILRKKISDIRNGIKPSLAEPVHTYKFLSNLYGCGTTIIKQLYKILKDRPDLFEKVQNHQVSLKEAYSEVLPETSKPQKPRVTLIKLAEGTYKTFTDLAKKVEMTPDDFLLKLIDLYNQSLQK